MFAFREGMQTLTDAIARHLSRVELGKAVTGEAPSSAKELADSNAIIESISS